VPPPRRPLGARRGHGPDPTRHLGAPRNARLTSRRPFGRDSAIAGARSARNPRRSRFGTVRGPGAWTHRK
jgi:hypothetical protein